MAATPASRAAAYRRGARIPRARLWRGWNAQKLAETGRTDTAGGTQCWHERTTAELADHIAATLWNEQNPLFLAWFYGRMIAGASQDARGEQPPRGPAGVIARKRRPQPIDARRRLTVVQ